MNMEENTNKGTCIDEAK